MPLTESSPEAEQILRECYRRMPPEQKHFVCSVVPSGLGYIRSVHFPDRLATSRRWCHDDGSIDSN